MNWISFVWPMVTATCLTLAMINLRIVMGDARRGPHLFFCLAACAVAAVSVFELMLLRTKDLDHYNEVLRWAALPIWVMVASVTGFIWSFFRTGRLWLACTAVGLNLVANLMNIISDVPVVRHAVALHQAETFGGVEFTVSTIENGPWDVVEMLSVLMVIAFMSESSWRLWRSGGRRRAVMVGGSVIFFLLLSRGHAVLVEKGMLEAPYFVSMCFIAVIIAMGMELGNDVLRATNLARELQSSQRRIDLAGQAVSLGFWEWDIVTGEIWANETARQLFGVKATEVVDLDRFLTLVYEDDRAAVTHAIKESVEGGKDYEMEYRVRGEGGNLRWISARGRVENENGRSPLRMRGVLLDVTEKRSSETELHQLRGQLAHAGRVSIMGQLAAALAHELNQPLGAILRNAEAAELFLQSPSPDIEEIRAIVRDIIRDDQRAGGVIDRLRSLMKRKQIEPRVIPVKELLEEVMALIRADAAARDVLLEWDASHEMPEVLGDRVHLQQVLINLLINAMDAMAETKREERRVTLACERTADERFVKIRVIDTGPGIPAGLRAQMFEPFFTTKADGMGMGLSISRAIIEAHRGRLDVSSSHEGACFEFTLPVAESGGSGDFAGTEDER
jgi:two-component system, LuxR family, sensor kinase FixL